MAEALDSENAAFWLPTHFLTDDDFLSDEVCLKRDSIRNDFDLFDNSLAGFNLNSSLDSPVSSIETELGDGIDSNNIKNDEFMAELTRHLAQSTLNDSSDELHNVQKPWMFSTSPQSTLTGFGPWTSRSGFSSNGSPNGPSQVPSPPLTPPAKNDAAWELLFEAAGQVARLKMNALAAQINQQNQNRGIMRAPQNIPFSSKSHHHHHHNSFYDFPQHEQVKSQSNGKFYCQHHSHNHNQQRSAPLGLPQSAWPPLRPNHHHHHRQPSNGSGMRPSYLNGPGIPGIKRQSTGTGVFLPRRVGTTPTHQQPEPRKKPSVIHPTRVVEPLNMNYEEMKMKNEFQSKHNSRYGTGMLSEQEILMARRNAILEHQKNLLKNEMVTHEISLPSDWTY